MRQVFAIALMVLALVGAGPSVAQQSSDLSLGEPASGQVISPVLTIDRARMLRDSAFGRRLLRDNQVRLAELEAENRKITAELAAEEQELTKTRSEMELQDFRPLADAFDEKVQRTEQAQLAKNTALREVWAKEEAAFFQALRPVLEQLMREAGAAVILERSSVYVSVSQVDITDNAIALLDETIGSGAAPD